jgi:Zn-dependent protease/CBS domain-containing protein
VVRGIPLLSIAGIRVRAHWSVLVVAGLLAWGLAEAVIPAAAPDASFVLRWSLAIAAAAVMIISLTAHELAHSVVARRQGATVDGITLWLFGGVSQIHDDWPSAGTELRVAAAGPAVTVLTAALFLGVAYGLSALGAPPVITVVAKWLFAVNVLLLIFNLLPAFPLDGGRILRAILWKIRNDRAAATRAAARGGRVFAYLIMAAGLADFFLTGDFGGAWIVFIGWFLDASARREQQGESIRALLQDVHVGDAMSRDPVRVPSWITVDLLLDHYVVRSNLTSFVTHGVDGHLDGLITLQAIRRVPRNQLSRKRAADIAVPIDAVPTAAPGELLTDLLSRMTPRTEGRALVFDQGQLVGVVAPADVARVLATIRPPRGMRPLPPPPPLPPAAEVTTPRT